MEPDNERAIATVMEELERLDRQVESIRDFAELKPAFYRAEAIAREHTASAAVQEKVWGLKQHIIRRGTTLREAPTEPQVTAETPTPATPESLIEPIPEPPPQPAIPPAPPEVPFRWKGAVAGGALVGFVLFTGLVLGVRSLEQRRAAPKPPVPVAAVTPKTTPAPVPQATALRIFTDLDAGQVAIDDQPAGSLQEGQFVLDQVPPAKHTVTVSGKHGEASFPLDVVAGAAPVVSGPVTAKNVLAIVVASAGSTANVRTSGSAMPVAVDGRAAGKTTTDQGLDLKNLSPGDHELTIGEGKDARKLVVGFGPAPAVTAFLKLDVNAGTLVVVAGVDNAKVLLNGKPYRRLTKDGQLRIPGLAVRDYKVRVEKAGLEPAAEQVAQVRKGEESRIEFKLKAIPTMAGLRLRGAAAGTAVVVDGNPIGSVGADGSFTTANLAPGLHTIELRKEHLTPKRMQKSFRAGETVEIGGRDVALEKPPATLRFQLAPGNARVTVRRHEEAQGRPVTENPARLPEGTYMITASATGYVSKSVEVQVAAGESKSVDIQLARERAAAPAAFGMAEWEDARGWTSQGNWTVHKGGNFVLYRPTPVTGTVVFTAALVKGKRLQWVANYVDSKNYALFQLDKKNFYRKDIVNGKTFELRKAPNIAEQSAYYTLQIEIAPNGITQRVFVENQWKVLDAWNQGGRNFTAGKFGFLIPGSDQIGLSNFTYTPR